MKGHDAAAIRDRVEELDRATLPFAQRRMDTAISAALVHQRVDDLESELPDEVHPHLREEK